MIIKKINNKKIIINNWKCNNKNKKYKGMKYNYLIFDYLK